MFEELDYQKTPLGDLVLRRRVDPALGGKMIYEVKLGDDFLMSSLFHEGETALAELGLADLTGTQLHVVVGGLGLGYTAAAALRHPAVDSLLVIEALSGVIDWHRRGLVPLGADLAGDPRCRFIRGDFFRMAGADGGGFDPDRAGRLFDAVLLDIDHAPDHLLHPDHAALYEPAGLRRLAERLRPGGVFALWSNQPPDGDFLQRLESCFAAAAAHGVAFPNPYTGGEAANTVYVARTAPVAETGVAA